MSVSQIFLLQAPFAVGFRYSTGGYGFLFNMPGYGSVAVGEKGVGGMSWQADAAPLLAACLRRIQVAAAGGG